jgi:hypothetical protein
MRIAMEKSGFVLAVKRLRLQRSNNIRYLIFVLIVRLSFCFHGSWRNSQFIFLTSALWTLLIDVLVSRRFSCQETRMGSEPCIHSVSRWISIWILYYLESRCPKQGLLRTILTLSNWFFHNNLGCEVDLLQDLFFSDLNFAKKAILNWKEMMCGRRRI